MTSVPPPKVKVSGLMFTGMQKCILISTPVPWELRICSTVEALLIDTSEVRTPMVQRTLSTIPIPIETSRLVIHKQPLRQGHRVILDNMVCLLACSLKRGLRVGHSVCSV